MGVTCDTPLNSWSNHSWLNYLTNDPVGERLDYIFYRDTPEMVCTSVEVAVREQISGIGAPNSGAKNYSDHFGVHAQFAIQPAVYHFQNRTPALALSNSTFSMGSAASPATTSSGTIGSSQDQALKYGVSEQDRGLSVDTLEQILMILKQHMEQSLRRPRLELKVIFPLMLLSALILIIALFWIKPQWAAFIVALIVSALSAGWIVHFLYGFLFGGELSSAFLNVIQEVESVIDYKVAHEGSGSRANSSRGVPGTNGGRTGLLQK